jgi:hypothetical protein
LPESRRPLFAVMLYFTERFGGEPLSASPQNAPIPLRRGHYD